MFGIVYVSLKGISPVETEAQDIGADVVETIGFAVKNGLRVTIKDMTECGAVVAENLHAVSGAIAGYIPALDKTIAIESGKITFATPV